MRHQGIECGQLRRGVGRWFGDSGEDGGFGQVRPGEFADALAIPEDQGTGADANNFIDFGTDEENGHSPLAERGDQRIDFSASADVDAAGGFIEDEKSGLDGEPAGEENFLLIAAGECSDG